MQWWHVYFVDFLDFLVHICFCFCFSLYLFVVMCLRVSVSEKSQMGYNDLKQIVHNFPMCQKNQTLFTVRS